MRVGIFSDMHGNYVALEAALTDLSRREVDSYICLGDAVQGGSQPSEIVERLAEIDCKVVLGNSDSFILTGSPGGDSKEAVSEVMMQIRDWTREQLGQDGLEYLSSFPETIEVELEDGSKLLCFHGSPRSFNEVLLPELEPQEIAPAFESASPGWLAGGHTHLQWTRSFGDQKFFNPGSAGVAYNRYMEREKFYFYPIAQYAILHSDKDGTTVEFGQAPFDVDALDSAAKNSGRPTAEGEASRYRPPVGKSWLA